MSVAVDVLGSESLQICVFGGLQVRRTGVPAEVRSPQLTVVLSALIAARGRAVAVADLVELVWDSHPSHSAVNQLHRLVAQLRRLFEPQLVQRQQGRWIKSVGGGYRLVVDSSTSDLAAFTALTTAARDASSSMAVDTYRRALELVKEPAFSGLSSAVRERPEFVMVERERIQAAVEAANLAVVEPAAIGFLPLLERIAESAPLHEVLQAGVVQLLTAAGRRAEALILFDRIRRRLADELGTDPGHELANAYRRALDISDHPAGMRPAASGPITLRADAGVAVEAPELPVPAGLPRPVSGFIARDDLAHLLNEQLPIAAGTSTNAVVVLSGKGGVGKTTLAVEWAHRHSNDFPDGQLYLDARGSALSGPLSPVDALSALLASAGVPSASIAAEVAGRIGQWRTILAQRRMILVLDDVQDTEQVRPLLPGSAGCLVIVTSRNHLTGLITHEGAQLIRVDRLDAETGRELLAARLGRARLSAEPEAADQIMRWCAGLPLALSIVAARITVRSDLRLADVAAELAGLGPGLDALPSDQELSTQLQLLRQLGVEADLSPAPVPATATADRSLPADIAGFVGRQAQLQHLFTVIDKAAHEPTQAIAIHAVDGMAGVGKTTFAVHVAHQLADRFPDGQRFVHLRGHAPGQSPVDPATALETLLQADGVAPQQIPSGLDARAALWRNRMADKKLLLVLDDATDARHVTPLLPGTPGCLVLITSRRKLATLPNAVPLSLEILPAADAAELFVRRAGPRAAAHPAAVHHIARLCGYLPLAITLTAARLYSHPAWTVADLADDLEEARDRLLGELASGDLAVDAAFELSYRDLSADRQQLFRRLGMHPGPDFDAYAAAAISDTTVAVARRGLETLLEHNLLTEPRRGRYRFHDLIAEHAHAHAATDSAAEREAALDGLLTYYLHTATAASHQRSTPAIADDCANTPSPETPTFTTPQQATDWLTAELANLAASTGAAAHHEAAIGIPTALHDYLCNRGPFEQAFRFQHIALDTARHTQNKHAEATVLVNLADLHHLTGDYPAAAATAGQAQSLLQQVGDQRGQANALIILARLQFARGDLPDAAATAAQARKLFQHVGDQRGQANALNLLARLDDTNGNRLVAATTAEQAQILFQQVGDQGGQAEALRTVAGLQFGRGDIEAAAVTAERAHALFQQTGDRRGQANTLKTIARLQSASGDLPAAAATAERGSALFHQIADRHGQADALNTVARVHHASGNQQGAAAAAEQACTIFQQIGHRLGQANALNTLARVHHASGDYPSAMAAAAQALTLCQYVGSQHGQANSQQILGTVQHATGELSAAATTLAHALDDFRAVADIDGEAETLNHIGQLQLDTGAPDAAYQSFTTALSIARHIDRPIHEARALEGVGLCLLHEGHHEASIQSLREAFSIFQRLNSPRAVLVEALLHTETG